MTDARPLDVLLVEDDPTTGMALRVLLHQRGQMDVRWVETLAEARDALRDREPDCVILDLMLPDGPGEELLRDVRDSGLSSRVVVVTGCLPGSARMTRVQSLGPNSVLSKPYELDELMSAVSGGAS